MRKFMSVLAAASLLTAVPAIGAAAQAKDYNQWQIMPQKQAAAKSSGGEGEGTKPQRNRRQRVRLVNARDKNNRLSLSCGVNTGKMQLNMALAGAGADKAAAKTAKTAENSGKSEEVSLNLAIDGKAVLKDKAARRKITPRGRELARGRIEGEDMTLFISRFLAAKKDIAVSIGGGAAESFSAANAAQAGLALQNCLHK